MQVHSLCESVEAISRPLYESSNLRESEEIRQRMISLPDRDARPYGSAQGIIFPAEAEEAYKFDVNSALGRTAEIAKVLDVRAGTGLLTK